MDYYWKTAIIIQCNGLEFEKWRSDFDLSENRQTNTKHDYLATAELGNSYDTVFKPEAL